MPAFTKPQAVIFDLDGVIVDSEPHHEAAFLEIFAALGLGESHGLDFTQYYGRSDRTLMNDFVARHQPQQDVEELLAWKHRCFVARLHATRPIFPSVPALIERLSARYRLAIASGSLHPVISEVLALDNLRRFFHSVVSVQDVRVGKPEPDIFLHAARLLGVAPADCWVIEDSAAGVTAARAAGMQVVAITNSLPAERLSAATVVVRTYAEIEALLLPPDPHRDPSARA